MYVLGLPYYLRDSTRSCRVSRRHLCDRFPSPHSFSPFVTRCALFLLAHLHHPDEPQPRQRSLDLYGSCCCFNGFLTRIPRAVDTQWIALRVQTCCSWPRNAYPGAESAVSSSQTCVGAICQRAGIPITCTSSDGQSRWCWLPHFSVFE